MKHKHHVVKIGSTTVGGGPFSVWAGPCSVESQSNFPPQPLWSSVWEEPVYAAASSNCVRTLRPSKGWVAKPSPS